MTYDEIRILIVHHCKMVAERDKNLSYDDLIALLCKIEQYRCMLKDAWQNRR